VKLTLVSGAIQSYAWRANSIYDPNYTGVGHQPLGRDQWTVIYGHYFVRASRARFHFNVDSSVNDTLMAVANLDDDGAFAGTINTLAEQSNSAVRVFPGVVADPEQITLDVAFSSKRSYGRGGQQDSLGAEAGASPVRQQFFMFSVASVSASSTCSGNVSVSIEYDVEFSEPLELGVS